MLTLILILATTAAGAVSGAHVVAASALAVAPILVFLTGALAIAGLAREAGLADRTALVLARAARGRTPVLYALVCATCALLTAAVSLDGAVVLMIPVLRALEGRAGAPFRLLFLGTIGVANAFSMAVPQGNPTNLVIQHRLGVSPVEFADRMLVPALVATAVCVVAPMLRERRSLALGCRSDVGRSGPLSRLERLAAVAVVAAAAGSWGAPLFGIAAWLPVAVVAAAALLLARTRKPLRVPWKLGLQIGAMLAVCTALGLGRLAPHGSGLVLLLATALTTAVAAALVNNLPVSALVATVLTGQGAYAGLVGLSVGSLATPHGSVATLIANDLADGAELSPSRHVRLWLVPAAVGVLAAALVLGLTRPF